MQYSKVQRTQHIYRMVFGNTNNYGEQTMNKAAEFSFVQLHFKSIGWTLAALFTIIGAAVLIRCSSKACCAKMAK